MTGLAGVIVGGALSTVVSIGCGSSPSSVRELEGGVWTYRCHCWTMVRTWYHVLVGHGGCWLWDVGVSVRGEGNDSPLLLLLKETGIGAIKSQVAIVKRHGQRWGWHGCVGHCQSPIGVANAGAGACCPSSMVVGMGHCHQCQRQK